MDSESSQQVNKLISALQNVTNALTKDEGRERASRAPIDQVDKKPDSSKAKQSLRDVAIILGRSFQDAMLKPINKLKSGDKDQKETKSASTEEIIQQLKLGNTSNTKMLSQMEVMTKKPSAEEQLKQEKMVVKAPTNMVIKDIDSKAAKKFTGIFSKIGNVFKPAVKPRSGGNNAADKPGWLVPLLAAAGTLGIQLADLPIRIAKNIGSAVIDGASWLGRKTIEGVRWVGGKAFDMFMGTVDMGKRSLEWIGKKTTTGMRWAGEKVSGMFKETVNMGRRSLEWLGEKYKNMTKIINLESMKKQWINFTKWTGARWSKFTDVVSGRWSGLSKSLLKMYDGVKQSIFSTSKAVSNMLPKKGIVELARGLTTNITNMFKPKGVAAGMARLSGEASSSILGTVTKLIPKGGSLLSMVGRFAKFAGPIGAIVAGGMAVFDGVAAATEEYKKSGSILAAAREGVAGALSGLTFGLVDQETFSGIMSSIGDGVGWVADKMASQFGSAWDGIKNLATGNIVEGLGHIGSMLTYGLVDNETISGAINSVSETFSKAGKWLSSGAGKVWDSIAGFFTNSPDVWTVFDATGKQLSAGTQKVAKSVNNVTSASMSFEQTTKGLSEQMKRGEKQAEILTKDQQAALLAANKRKNNLASDILDVHGIDKQLLVTVNDKSVSFVNAVMQMLDRATVRVSLASAHLNRLDQTIKLNAVERKETSSEIKSNNNASEIITQRGEPTSIDNSLVNNITNAEPPRKLDIAIPGNQNNVLQSNLAELIRIAGEQLIVMNRSIDNSQQTARELIDAMKTIKNNNTVVSNNNTSVVNNSTSVSEASSLRSRALANM